MPAVSFYLKRDVLDSVRARAKSRKIPVSQIISKAVEEYLKTDEMSAARKNVLERLKRGNWLGKWEDLHGERSRSDANRN